MERTNGTDSSMESSSSASTSTITPTQATTTTTSTPIAISTGAIVPVASLNKDKVFDGDDDDPERDILVDSPLRVFGYFSRIGRLIGMTSSKGVRYMSYSSDVIEAFRPVVNKRWIYFGYGISIAYVVGDIGYNSYLAKIKNKDVNRAFAHAFTFHLLGSLVFPAIVIHFTVHQSEKFFHRVNKFRKWGPILAGLGMIPILPFAVDIPTEHAIDWAFEKYWPEHEPSHTKNQKTFSQVQANNSTPSTSTTTISHSIEEINNISLDIKKKQE